MIFVDASFSRVLNMKTKRTRFALTLKRLS
jgi:hypothetical protein